MRAPGVRVVAASTTRRPNGDLVLLVRTEAGPGALVFSPHLAKKLFVVTNPVTAHAPIVPAASITPQPAPALVPAAEPSTPPPLTPAAEEPGPARMLRTKEQRRELYQKLCAEIARHQGAHGATSIVLRLHNITTASFYSWRREFGFIAPSS